MRPRPIDTVYFFGCRNGDSGHYFFGPGQDSSPFHPERGEKVVPWGFNIDGGLQPKGPEIQGLVAFSQHRSQVAGRLDDVWSAISWADRSVDKRPGSNITFFVNQEMTAGLLLQRARVVYPEVFARFTYPLTMPPEA